VRVVRARAHTGKGISPVGDSGRYRSLQALRSLIPVALAAALLVPAGAMFPAAAQAPQEHSWIVADLLRQAKAEAALTVYGSMNEAEALPLWQLFEDATGVKVSYVRSSDTQIMARVAIEERARQHSWDLAVTTTVSQFPQQFLAAFAPPQAAALTAQARDPAQRWYGVYANYNAPAYNTKLVDKADLPKSYDDFPAHKDWIGKIAIDSTDNEWLAALFTYYGDARARALVQNIVGALNPVLTDGHLALARSVGSGEYSLALNNFLNLTLNVKMSGAPADFWLINPVALIFGSVGINALAPHPAAAELAENFLLSRQAQIFITRKGRFPTRPDVPTNPPEIGELLKPMTIVPVLFNGTDERQWQKMFNALFGRS
jgi:iron(III) transport system substrate-binding protein